MFLSFIRQDLTR